MSQVPKSERNEEPEFFTVARKLKIMTVRKIAKNMPKRLMHGIGDPMMLLATKAKEHIMAANSIYPTTKREAQDRHRLLMTASAEIKALISDIDDLMENEMRLELSLSYDDADEWTGTAAHLAGLIKGVMESDTRRFRNLP